MLILRISTGGVWLLAVQILWICFGCQQPSPSKKGFNIDDPENVFFAYRRKDFIMYENSKAKDTLIKKAEFNDVYNSYLFYNAKLDKIYNFSWMKKGHGQIIQIYDGPKGKPKQIGERRTAYYSVFSYKDNYLIVSPFLFSPEKEHKNKGKLTIGYALYSDTAFSEYSEAFLLETSEEDNRFTKTYDFYHTIGFTQDSMLYASMGGDFFCLNMENGETEKIYRYNYFEYYFLEDGYSARELPYFLTTAQKALPPPNQPIVLGSDIYMIPQNFVFLGKSYTPQYVRNLLYKTYKINTLYKHLGNNKFEKVLKVPMSKDVEWSIGMGDHIFFIGQKNKNQIEVVRYNVSTKEIKQLILNKKDYFVYRAIQTKDYIVMLISNHEVDRNKHILGIVPKDLKGEPKFYPLPAYFDISNPIHFGLSSKYGRDYSGDFIGNPYSRITRYDSDLLYSIMSKNEYYGNAGSSD